MKKKRVFTTILVSLLSLLLVLLVGCSGSGNQPSDGSGKQPSGEQGGGGAVVDTRPLLTLSSNIENAGTLTGGGHYSYNDDLRIKATVNSGYHFLGWYNGNDLLSTSAEYNCKMWDKSVTLEAKFLAVPKEQSGNLGTGDLINKKFTLCVKSSSPLLGKINVNDNGNIEEYTLETTAGANIKALSLTISSQAFLGWFDEAGNLVMANGVFDFAMPPFDYTLTAKWDCDCKEYIYNSERGCLVCTVCGGEDKNNDWVIQENVLTKYKGSGTSVTIPEGVLSIGERAFSDCTGLTSVTIPASVTSIGYSAFSGCTGLTSMTLPFVGASLNGTSNKHFGYIFGARSYSDNNSYVPTSLKTVVITGGLTIGSDAFYNCKSLTSVTIPAGVTSIGSYAFYNCTGLVSVTFGENSQLTSIGNSAFYNCTGLTSITIPEGVTSIDEDAFRDCTGLTSITVDSGNTVYRSAGNCLIETASKMLILGCKNSVIPTDGSVTSIGWHAFYGCTGLTSITIPASVTSIGSSAFYGCTALKSVSFGENSQLTSIGGYAFSDCTGLTSITIPDSVTSIGSHAFYGCTGLTAITIPDSVTSIGSHAFYGCTGLTSMTLPFVGASLNGTINKHFGYIFGARYYSDNNSYVPTSLKTVVITGGSTIGYDAFRGCTGLTSITIPDSVTSIYSDAFSGCTGLTSITIPASVTSIGNPAFYGCTGLKKVYYGGTASGWSSISIGGGNSILTSATRYYYSANAPTTSGNYWHYDGNGNVVEW